jgi:hypothetical protein
MREIVRDPKKATNDVLGLMLAAMQLYDDGNENAGISIAGHLYVLLVDRGRTSISLFKQIGLEEALLNSTLRFGFLYDENLIVVISAGDTVKFSPPASAIYSEVQVGDWLNETIWSRDKFRITRKQLIESVRDKEGFGHFDKALYSGPYFNLLREALLGIQWAKTNSGCLLRANSKDNINYSRLHVVSQVPNQDADPPEILSQFEYIDNIHLASLRQMANEVFSSLINFPEFNCHEFAFRLLEQRKLMKETKQENG